MKGETMKTSLIISILVLISVSLMAQSSPTWQWAANGGGSTDDFCYSISRDSAGNCYATGTFTGTIALGPTVLVSAGAEDVCVAKTDPNGNVLWIAQAGGINSDSGFGIATDALGNSYVTGYYQGSISFGSLVLNAVGSNDVFVAKIDPSGTWLWAESAGGSGNDKAMGIVLGPGGVSYITGSFSGTASFGNTDLTTSGGTDVFIASVTSDGDITGAVKAGGPINDTANAIAIDAGGNCYITGSYTMSATFGGYDIAAAGSLDDIFVAKLSSAGVWQWAETAGGTSLDIGKSISVDNEGACFVTGNFNGSATFGSQVLNSGGGTDFFVARLGSGSGDWAWAIRGGGTLSDSGNGIAADGSGNCIVTGFFQDTVDFGTTFLSSSGARDVFVGKVSWGGSWQWAVRGGGPDDDLGVAINIDTDSNNYITGYFQSTLGASVFGSSNLISNGGRDVFVAKLGYASITTPQIYVMGTLSAFSTEVGIPSDPQSYQLYGQDLTADILITPPAGFEVSVDGGTSYSATASVPPTYYGMVHVRLTGATTGSFDGNISHTSPGAAYVNLFVEGSVNDLPATLEVMPSTWDFGSIPLGEPILTTVTLTCSGSAGSSVTVSSFWLDGSGDFSLYNPPATPLVVTSGTSEYIDVVFTPTSLGLGEAWLTVYELGGGPQEVHFSGVGAPPSSTGLFVTPSTYDFASTVAVGDSGSCDIYVNMDWTYPLSQVTVMSADIGGDPAFSLSPDILNSLGQPVTLPYDLNTGEQLMFTAIFNPTNNTYQTATLTFWDEFGLTASCTLTAFGGTVTTGPLIEVTPDPINVTMPQNSTTNGEFQIHNNGDETLMWNIPPGYSPPFMSIYTTTGSIAPGGIETVNYQVNSTGLPLGPTSGSITIDNNDATHPTYNLAVNLTVTNVVSLVATPDYHDFGSTIMPGESGSVNISITQNPLWPLSSATVTNAVLTGDPAFSLWPDVNDATGSPITLPYELWGSGMAVFTVEFEPWDTNYQAATLTVYGSSGDSVMVDIEAFGGSVTVGPVISVVPSTVNVNMNTNALSSGIITVYNTGTENLTFNIPSTSIPPELSLYPLSGTVAPGDSMNLQYTVHSTTLAAGSYVRTVEIISNDPNHTPWVVTFNIDVTATTVQIDFTGVPLSGHAPLEVQFTDQSTVAAGGWRWDFENDGVVDSYLQNPLHTYQMPGLYTVRLVVINVTGVYMERIKTNYISVTNNPPQIVPGAPTQQEFMEDATGGPYDLTEIFFDPDSDPLTYTVQGSAHISGHVTPAGPVAPPLLYLNATANWFGTEYITVVAQDPYKGAVSHVLEITVLPVNDAPVLSVPDILYFIRYSTLHVDFSDYITDPDNNMGELSIQIVPLGPGEINFHYTPVNLPNQLGQFTVDFVTPVQFDYQEQFRIVVNDHVNRATSQQEFYVHVLHHFTPQAQVDASFQFTGQNVEFNDATLGNPTDWLWDFGDGATSGEQSPSHAYANAGIYTVQLTLWNAQANLQENLTASVSFQLTMQGTAVNPAFIPPTWTPQGSPYNLFGDIVIPPADIVVIQPNVEVNLFGSNPLTIEGSMNANQARFRSQTGSGFWGGLRFTGGGTRPESQLNGCDIVDALLPVDIEGQSPILNGLVITVTDTTAVQDSVAIRIRGASSAELNDVDILNYKGGILIQTDPDARTSSSLTNIRIRTSEEGSRQTPEGSIGCTIMSDATLNDVEIINCETGLRIEALPDDRELSSPSLTNIRVRTSEEGSRQMQTGLVISGAIAPQIDSLLIEGVQNGVVLQNGTDYQRTATSLTNIRIRTSEEGSRETGCGLMLENVPSLTLDTAEFEGFYNGIVISNQQRDLSSPSLTNIRVRTSEEGSRTESVGIGIDGAVVAAIDDAVIEGYPYGIKYFGAPTRTTSSASLTNIRIRTSEEGSRQAGIGMQLRDLDRVIVENDSIVGYNVGLEIMNSDAVRDLSTPSLTNIRVRNSEEGSRYENAGIYLGPGIAGTLGNCIVEEARIGIFIADGNQTVINPNQIFNCETGIKAAGALLPKPIRRQLIALELAFHNEHPDWQFKALDLNLAGPWVVENNTIFGYNKLAKATDAGIAFTNNIGWTLQPMQQPFELTNSVILVDYCDISSNYPGIQNINADPCFTDWLNRYYTITFDSPCIDAGSPLLPHDIDGSMSDIGVYPYVHRASMTADMRFVQTGDTVHFTNTSLGHNHPISTTQWDLNNDGTIEATSRDWVHLFNEPGIYDLALIMNTGTLHDVKVYNAVVVVQDYLLQAPQNPTLAVQGNDILVSWEPVTQMVNGDPVPVDYYIVYSSAQPQGYFDLAGYVGGGQTSLLHQGGALHERQFYIIIGYYGVRGDVMEFIQQHPRILIGDDTAPLRMRSRK
jgi:PKD repeat protein